MGLEVPKACVINNAEQMARSAGIDTQKIDFKSLIDSSLSHKENLDMIEEELQKHTGEIEAPAKDAIRAQQRELDQKYKDKLTEQKQKERQKFLEQDNKSEEVQSYYTHFNQYARAVARGQHHAMMVNAPPGIGKSFQLTNVVLPEEVGTNGFAVQSGYCPPFQFYKKLWEVQRSQADVLVLDDIEGLINSKKALAILKQATWSAQDSRVVEWNSSSSKLEDENGEDIPPKFEFDGRLIMVFNKVDQEDPIVNSLMDRCFYYELDFSYEQRVKLVQSVAEQGVGLGVPKEERVKVADWLHDITNPEVRDFNIRTLEEALRIYKFKSTEDNDVDQAEFESLVEPLIEVDRKLYVVRDIIVNQTHDSVSDQVQEFKDRTGESRRTFYRVRDELAEKSEKVSEILS
jgi:hypothetical protein